MDYDDIIEERLKDYGDSFSLLDVVRVYQEQGGFPEGQLTRKQITDLRVMCIKFVLDMAFHYNIQVDITIDFISEVIRRQQTLLPFESDDTVATELVTRPYPS